MTLRQIVIFETLPTEKVLTEDKVSAFVKNVLDRYENPLRAPRIEAAMKLSKRNPKDGVLLLDNDKPCSTWQFRAFAISAFKKLNKTKMTLDEFSKILELYLQNYREKDGTLKNKTNH